MVDVGMTTYYNLTNVDALTMHIRTIKMDTLDDRNEAVYQLDSIRYEMPDSDSQFLGKFPT